MCSGFAIAAGLIAFRNQLVPGLLREALVAVLHGAGAGTGGKVEDLGAGVNDIALRSGDGVVLVRPVSGGENFQTGGLLLGGDGKAISIGGEENISL